MQGVPPYVTKVIITDFSFLLFIISQKLLAGHHLQRGAQHPLGTSTFSV